MAYKYLDRVFETAVVTGTGAFTLGGAYNGSFFAFSTQMATGDTANVVITDTVTYATEIVLCTYNSGTNQLTPSTVYHSTNSGSLVSFAGNTCQVYGVVSNHDYSGFVTTVAGNAGPSITTAQLNTALNLSLGGALTTANAFTVAGNFAATLNLTAATNVTVPVSGTLDTTALRASAIASAIPSGTTLQLYQGVGSAGTLNPVTISGDATIANGGSLSVGSIGGHAVSLAGAITFAGAYGVTFTATATTNLTLPPSGTVATQAYVSGLGYPSTATAPLAISSGNAVLNYSSNLRNNGGSLDLATLITTGTFETTGTAALYAQANYITAIGTNGISAVVGSGTQSATETFTVQSGAVFIEFIPNAGSGAFNGLVQAGDSVMVIQNGSSGTGNIVIGNWSGISGGNGARIGANGTHTLAGTWGLTSGSSISFTGGSATGLDASAQWQFPGGSGPVVTAGTYLADISVLQAETITGLTYQVASGTSVTASVINNGTTVTSIGSITLTADGALHTVSATGGNVVAIGNSFGLVIISPSGSGSCYFKINAHS